jgi:3-hydroxyisobutyrate dehydrogenase-like beta-hydroxyacid dehydrogenase
VTNGTGASSTTTLVLPRHSEIEKGKTMSKIAFLGLGAMGSRLVPHLIKAGHIVTVWNRSPAAVETAVARVARSAATPREAAEGAEFVLTMLTDDDASKAVWMTADTGALSGLGEGSIAVEVSTVSPDWLKSLAAVVEAHGAHLLDAPVVGSLPQAEAAQHNLFSGGAEEAVKKAKPLLDCFASVAHHVGPQGRGAIMKLAANALLAIQVTAVAEALAVLDKSGIVPKRALEIIGGLPVMSPAGNGFTGLMVAGDYEPRFTAALIAKDLRYAVAEAAASRAKVPVLEASRGVFDELCAKGLGGESISAAIKVYRG